MKEMIKKIREEKGGFTLAELLIVVAIVLVLVAIAVPVFTGALNKAEDAVKAANERSVKAEATMAYMLAKDDAERNAVAGSIYWADGEGNITGPSETAPENAKYKYIVTVVGADPNVTIKAEEAPLDAA